MIGVVGADQGAVALDGFAFESNRDEGVVGGVVAAGEGGVFGEAKGGVGADFDAADEVVAGWDEDFAAAVGRGGVEGFLEDGGVFGFAVTEGALGVEVVGFWSGGATGCDE